MTEGLFWINLSSCIFIIVLYGRRPGGYTEFPLLFSLMYLFWYLPQAWILIDSPVVSQASLARVLVFSLLCILGLSVGWSRGLKGDRIPRQSINLPINRLLVPVLFLTIFSAVMQGLISSRPAEELVLAQWTGPITILAFLASVGVVSLVLSLAMVLRTPRATTISLAVANVALYMPSVLLYFRRAEIFELIMATLLALFFVRGRVIRTVPLVAGCLVALSLMFAVAQLRELGGGYELNREGRLVTRFPTFSEIAAIDWVAALSLPDAIRPSEVRNAVQQVESIDRSGSLTLGAEFWNTLVHLYVPGQFIGMDNKRELMVGQSLESLAEVEYRGRSVLGLTSTGFVTVYRDFWFYGALIFTLTGYWMGWLFQRARNGDLMGYLAYGSLVTLGVHTLTHSGYALFASGVLPLAACMLLARRARSGPMLADQVFVAGKSRPPSAGFRGAA